jgi:hypothetical protein
MISRLLLILSIIAFASTASAACDIHRQGKGFGGYSSAAGTSCDLSVKGAKPCPMMKKDGKPCPCPCPGMKEGRKPCPMMKDGKAPCAKDCMKKCDKCPQRKDCPMAGKKKDKAHCQKARTSASKPCPVSNGAAR